MPSERRVEPWPLALAALLLAMIGVSLGFLAVALAHPDPPVETAPPPAAEGTPARGAP